MKWQGHRENCTVMGFVTFSIELKFLGSYKRVDCKHIEEKIAYNLSET
jgi:hypothetical protein